MNIKIRLSPERIADLAKLYKTILMYPAHCFNEPDSDLTQHLLLHIKHFHHQLQIMIAKSQQSYSYTLTEIQADAFRKIWKDEPLVLDVYSAEIIRSMLAKIDQFFANQKTQIWHI